MTDDRLKVYFGFLLIVLLTILAAILGIGKVEQSTSFGLQDVLGGLLVISGSYANWCFGHNRSINPSEVPEKLNNS